MSISDSKYDAMILLTRTKVKKEEKGSYLSKKSCFLFPDALHQRFFRCRYPHFQRTHQGTIYTTIKHKTYFNSTKQNGIPSHLESLKHFTFSLFRSDSEKKYDDNHSLCENVQIITSNLSHCQTLHYFLISE